MIQCNIRDITERKRIEATLQASLAEKEILLREIHHRVKNNLQLISSMLRLQSTYVEAAPYRAMFEDCQGRIRSMAMIHERLYHSQKLASIDFGQHLRELATELVGSHSGAARNVRLQSEADPVSVHIGQAIPLGLIANELISNALKHAFPSGRAGLLRVVFRASESGQLLLSVSDDGVGLPRDFDLEKGHTLGLRMIRDLARQIRAQPAVRSNGGTTFEISFAQELQTQPEQLRPP